MTSYKSKFVAVALPLIGVLAITLGTASANASPVYMEYTFTSAGYNHTVATGDIIFSIDSNWFSQVGNVYGYQITGGGGSINFTNSALNTIQSANVSLLIDPIPGVTALYVDGGYANYGGDWYWGIDGLYTAMLNLAPYIDADIQLNSSPTGWELQTTEMRKNIKRVYGEWATQLPNQSDVSYGTRQINVTINAQTLSQVPEPMTLGLLGMGLLGMGAIRRRPANQK